ncbi:ribonuclease HII [Desulfolithobacter sp.]
MSRIMKASARAPVSRSRSGMQSVFESLATARIPDDTYAFERVLRDQGFATIGGVDEAGRGPLAGPVVAGCVVLPPDCCYQRFVDSKKLSASQREELFSYVHECGARIGVGVVSAREIDAINILQGSLLAMKRAVLDCMDGNTHLPIDFLLVDGKFTIPMQLPQQALVKGESKSSSIAAASIIAKVTRDRIMASYHETYPVYNFLKNKGYPTRDHRRAIAEHGPCPIHRRSFRGVREFSDPDQQRPSPCQRDLW